MTNDGALCAPATEIAPPPGIERREYQVEAVAASFAAWDEGVPSALIITGKTVEAATAVAHELLSIRDDATTLFQCNSPNIHKTSMVRTSYGPFELSVEDHLELIAALKLCQGKVVLSGYDNSLYRAALASWRVARFDVPNHSGQGAVKARRTEFC